MAILPVQQPIKLLKYTLFHYMLPYFNQFLASTSNLCRMNNILFKILYAFFSLSC